MPRLEQSPTPPLEGARTPVPAAVRVAERARRSVAARVTIAVYRAAGLPTGPPRAVKAFELPERQLRIAGQADAGVRQSGASTAADASVRHCGSGAPVFVAPRAKSLSKLGLVRAGGGGSPARIDRRNGVRSLRVRMARAMLDQMGG